MESIITKCIKKYNFDEKYLSNINKFYATIILIESTPESNEVYEYLTEKGLKITKPSQLKVLLLHFSVVKKQVEEYEKLGEFDALLQDPVRLTCKDAIARIKYLLHKCVIYRNQKGKYLPAIWNKLKFEREYGTDYLNFVEQSGETKEVVDTLGTQSIFPTLDSLDESPIVEQVPVVPTEENPATLEPTNPIDMLPTEPTPVVQENVIEPIFEAKSSVFDDSKEEQIVVFDNKEDIEDISLVPDKTMQLNVNDVTLEPDKLEKEARKALKKVTLTPDEDKKIDFNSVDTFVPEENKTNVSDDLENVSLSPELDETLVLPTGEIKEELAKTENTRKQDGNDYSYQLEVLSKEQRNALTDETFDKYEELSEAARTVIMEVYHIEEMPSVITDNITKLVADEVSNNITSDEDIIYLSITFKKNISEEEEKQLRNVISENFNKTDIMNINLGRM